MTLVPTERERLGAATPEQLDAWILALLDGESPERLLASIRDALGG